MRVAPLLALSLAGLAPAGAAQAPAVDPLPFAWTAAARETGFPFGHPDRRSVRHLEIHDGLAGRARTIAGIALRRSATDRHAVPAFRADVAMRLATATRPAAAVATTFDDNAGTDAVTVLPRRSVAFPPSAGGGGPAPFEYLLPCDVPFAFGGLGPLCVDLAVHDHTNGVPTGFDLHAEGYTHLGEVGPGCGGLQLRAAVSWPTADHTVTGIPPGGPVALLFGLGFDAVGGVPLPLDLSAAGAPGCALRLEPAVGVPGLADPSGAFQTVVPLDGAPPGAFYGVQAVAVQPGLNALGAITSNATVVVPWSGRVVGRVWSDDPSAATGLRQPVFGLVVEVR